MTKFCTLFIPDQLPFSLTRYKRPNIALQLNTLLFVSKHILILPVTLAKNKQRIRVITDYVVLNERLKLSLLSEPVSSRESWIVIIMK